MEVSFTPHITGTSGHTRKVDYILDTNSPIFTQLNDDQNFAYTFLESNNHYIKQVIYYNDGFKNITTEATYVIEMMPMAEFDYSDFECGLKFSTVTIQR